jgi:hypothetical protein
MNKPIFFVLFAFMCIASFWGCNKDANNYSTADHTAQVIIPRSWKGTVNGYFKGDTTIPPDTTHYEWAKIYNRVITDTSFVISKVDGFAVSALGITLSYRLTDSANKIMRFDSVATGSLNCVLIYNYVKDSMGLECHTVSGTNPLSGQYYQANFYLHTH